MELDNGEKRCRVCLIHQSEVEPMFASDQSIVLDLFLLTGVKVSNFLNKILLILKN